MEKKYSIRIERAFDTSALSDFRCGVQSMDNFIHDRENGLAKFIKLRLSNLWVVFEADKAVAFFALSKDALMLNNEDRRNIESWERNAAALPGSREYSAVHFYRSCGFGFSEVAQNKYNYDAMFGNQTTTRRMYKLIIPID